MLSKEILEQINSYVEKNLRFRPPKKIRLQADKMEICECRTVCRKILELPEEQLEKKLSAADKETFAEYLLRYMDERNANPVEVYKRAHLNRRFLSKLRTNRYYKPHKRTIFIIAFGLKLNLAETEDLLNRAGYSFSDYDMADVIIKFFFEQNIHDLFTVNEALDRYGCKPLGG
ncbi:MAG: hypothetical protein IJ685_03440 [Selenomonadaceae bacterium]|nr:hypothetical protein [Selenomonadaceae bacterium]